jgi:hypothetical protein
LFFYLDAEYQLDREKEIASTSGLPYAKHFTHIKLF